MTLSLSKPAAGDVGWSAAINQNWTDIENQSNNQATGPASATDDAIVRFDGTTGKLVQNSAVAISDTLGQISWPTGGGAGTRVLGPSDQDLAIAAESAGASSAGRALLLAGGPGGGTSGAGGAASLLGGSAVGSNSAGGAITIKTGNAGSSGDSGTLTLDTGTVTSGDPGPIIEKVGGKIRRVTAPPVTVPDNVETTLVTISLASGERVGFSLATFLVSTDGTDHQAVQCTFYGAAVNKAGSYGKQIVSVTSPAANSGSASFSAYTPTIQEGTNEIRVRVQVNSSLSSPTMTVASVLDMHHSGSNPTVTLP